MLYVDRLMTDCEECGEILGDGNCIRCAEHRMGNA